MGITQPPTSEVLATHILHRNDQRVDYLCKDIGMLGETRKVAERGNNYII